MIITALFLIIDCLVLNANGYTLLTYHSFFIAWLVIMLWRHRQPDRYNIDSQSLQNMSKTGEKVDVKNCLICRRLKPPRYYHCRRCQKCIFMMDHHCEWVGNCIGQYNSKVYFHLLLNVFVHSLFTTFVIAYNYDRLLDTSTRSFYFCLTLLPHLYALYQSYRLMQDFRQSVRNNVTLIESYKKVKGRKWDQKTGLKYHFGTNYYLWILPFFVNSPCDLLESTFPLPNSTVKQRVYADEYLDGSDSQDDPVMQQHNE